MIHWKYYLNLIILIFNIKGEAVMKICPMCNKKYENGNFCENCETPEGGPVKLKEEKKICPQCKKEYKLDAKFCSECGVKLSNEINLQVEKKGSR